ncbi:hypothetical protein K493DRAFT_360358 [Basidiobolus meristosporus CBS 931.73]|uniref:FAR1 domain-containing protein n=1 Tax=Basidiobolus meristosporus CBS 931.73 TaxID=1314790 RepID=A0A1Y1XIN7_9FUNG|nr:hypothetical protein K493DRAFT_360358 [Basidiobolus meristosporus CBS 931.73]|eukprot:ORX85627.1 hypothetical protein K493DRAFT_360358 [Basidiobolus meristosporus CBS 931.73]
MLSAGHVALREALFDVPPDGISFRKLEDFQEIWGLATNFWVMYSRKRVLKHGAVTTTYACRFEKHKKSSTKNPHVPANKRRRTTVREPGQCRVRIVVKVTPQSTVTVVRAQSSALHHTHSIEESDLLKRNDVIRDAIRKEAPNLDSSPGQIEVSIRETYGQVGAHHE